METAKQTYRYIYRPDGLDESFNDKHDFIIELASKTRWYDLGDFEFLVSFDRGWLILDKNQIISEVNSYKFEQEEALASERAHQSYIRSIANSDRGLYA